MGAKSKHYLPNGKEYKGPTHKDAKWKHYVRCIHTKNSQILVHKETYNHKSK